MIAPTRHERAEWARAARAAYDAQLFALGARFAAAAGSGARMTTAEHAALVLVHRAWRMCGEWPQTPANGADLGHKPNSSMLSTT